MTPNVIVSPVINFPVDAAARIADEINRILKQKSPVRIALSGGNTPRAVNMELTKHDIAWKNIYLYWSDERMVPHTNVDSNYRMNRDSLINFIEEFPGGIFPVAYNENPEIAADLYEKVLYKSLGNDLKMDITLLGMGEDGHIASLFSNQNYDDERLVVASISPDSPVNRVSMSLKFIAASTRIIVLINGSSKAARIAEVLSGKYEVPAAKLYQLRPDIVWLLDSAAAVCLTIGG